AISPNGLRVAAGVGEQIRVFDVASGRELQLLAEHTGVVRSLAFHNDNRTLVSAGADKTARLTDIAVASVLEAHPGGVAGVQDHNSGTQALTGGADKPVKLWDLNTGKVLKPFGPMAEPVSAVTFNRDYTQVGAAAGKVVKVWNVADAKEVQTLTHPAEVKSLSFSVDKTKVV